MFCIPEKIVNVHTWIKHLWCSPMALSWTSGHLSRHLTNYKRVETITTQQVAETHNGRTLWVQFNHVQISSNPRQSDKQSDKVWQSNYINSISMFSLCTGGVSSLKLAPLPGQDNAFVSKHVSINVWQYKQKQASAAVISRTKQQENGCQMVAGQMLLLDFHVRDSGIMALAAPRHV